uniref:OSJNBa0032N05.8 protein n=1 Tax=Oryza sativa subsp. japonica TaxID=39947 RepID=Q7XKP1_ORYSJ|nr:OSJNBa0032N05.8 [Oryza sativa Japonica Group]
MAPRKPNPASATGPDPGRIDDDTTAFLGASLVDDDELAKLVTSGALAENQAFAPGKVVVPKPGDKRKVVFAVLFEAGLQFLGNVLLPEILRLFQVELPQLSPMANIQIAIFDWACRTAGFEPSTELFDTIFYATVNSKTVVTPAGTKKTAFGSVNFNVRPERSDLWKVNAAMPKWDHHWMLKWFYHSIPFEAGFEEAKALRWRRRAIAPNRKPKVTVDGAMEARFALLRKADIEARKMIGDVLIAEFGQLLMRQAAGRANRVYDGDLPPRAKPFKADGDEGTSRKRTHRQVKLAPRKRRAPTSTDSDAHDEDTVEDHDGEEEGEDEGETEATAEKAADEATNNRTEMRGYTPTPSPDHVKTGVESNSSPHRRKDLKGAKALVSIAAAKVAKGCLVKKTSKKKGLVDVARVFSDDESLDETLTSPAGRSLGISTIPGAAVDAGGAGGSVAVGTSASADRVVKAAASLYGSPVRKLVASPLAIEKGKKKAAETSASEYSLAVPHFAPADFDTRADLVPFVEGVSNLVSLVGSPSLFTELNGFDEGYSTIKSLAVRILAAHCSTERTMRAHLDGFKSRLRAKDDELGRKSLEMESLANTLKETKAKNERLQAELEKGSEAKTKIERLKAELKKEQDFSAALTEYYNLTEPKMEALRQEALKA